MSQGFIQAPHLFLLGFGTLMKAHRHVEAVPGDCGQHSDKTEKKNNECPTRNQSAWDVYIGRQRQRNFLSDRFLCW